MLPDPTLSGEAQRALKHDLHNPLSAILGLVGTLLTRLSGPLNHDQEEQLLAIESSAMRLLTLIDNLFEPGPPATREPVTLPARATANDAARARILIVDDRRENLVLAGYMLEPLGHELLISQHVDEALSLACRQVPDLILCDINLVRNTGFDLLAACKANPQLRQIPFVLLSAIDCTDLERARGLALGACRIAVRPSNPDELMKLVQECLKQ